MEHIKKEDSIQGFLNDACSVIEYPSRDAHINIGIAVLNGRYPENGFAYNEKSTEMAYCLKGEGKLSTQSKTVGFKEGDVVIIPPGERYFWEGNMTILLPCTPAWKADQHKQEVNKA